jgi:hypothetical protein
MDTGGAVKVECWAAQEGDLGLVQPEGIEEFKTELARNYVGQVHARPGSLGGLYGFVVEFLTTFSLHRFLDLIVDGIAYDLIKSGSDALVLRPFLSAYKALRQRNVGRFSEISIERLLLSFQDSIVVIHELTHHSIERNLEHILTTLAANYKYLILRTGERPFLVSIPVVEDPAEHRSCRFRELLEIDETIRDITDERYSALWGIQYDYARTTRVYDVERRVLLDQGFHTQAQHWDAVYEERRRRNVD